MNNARFIVFEGIDGCGKSTQVSLLADALRARGRRVCVTAEPTGGAAGKMLREALSGKTPRTDAEMAALFLLDRVEHNVAPDGIAAKLAAEEDVISDRYYYSSLAYQGSVCDFEWVRAMNCDCPAIRHPDLCVFLDLTPDEALARVRARGEAHEIYEEKATLSRVRRTFLSVFEKVGDRVAVVDAKGTPEEVATRVIKAVDAVL